MIQINEVKKWTDQIEELQIQGKFQDTANLVKKIYELFESYTFRGLNDTEWITILLHEETLRILNE